MNRMSRYFLCAAVGWVAAFGLTSCGGGSGGAGGWAFSGSTRWTDWKDVRVAGNMAFVTAADGLLVIDITDGRNPFEVSRIYLQGGDGLAVKDSVAFVACHGLGVAAVDVLDPAHPRLIGRLTEGLTFATALALKGTTLLVGDDAKGVVTVDISNPATMRVLGWASPAGVGRILNIRADGDKVYAGAGRAGVLIVNMSDPTSPSLVSETPIDGRHMTDVMPIGNTVLATDASGRLTSLDAIDPASPIVVTQTDVMRVGRGMALKGSDLYVLGGTGMTLVDVANPATPSVVAKTDAGGDAVRGVFEGDMLHVASGSSGYQIYDTGAGAAVPVARGWLRTNGRIRSAVADSGYLYLSDGNENRILVDIPGKNGAVPFSSTDVPGRVFKLDVGKNRLVAFLEGGTVLFYNKRDPSQLTVSGRYLPSNDLFSGTLQGNRMLLGTDARAVEVVDIHDPDSPAFLYRVFVNDLSVGAFLKGNYLIAADSMGGFVVLDVRDPANPVEMIHVPGTSETAAMILDGERLWLATVGEGIRLFDVSNPVVPVVIGGVGKDVVGSVFAMQLLGDLLAVGSQEGGVTLLRPQGKTAKLLFQYPTPGQAQSFTRIGNRLFVADVSSVCEFGSN